jgi:hypothetical protein
MQKPCMRWAVFIDISTEGEGGRSNLSNGIEKIHQLAKKRSVDDAYSSAARKQLAYGSFSRQHISQRKWTPEPPG